MKRLLLAAVTLLTAARPGAAQSVSPLIAEYDRPTTGRFEVQNTGLYPVTVVVEAKGFHLDPEGVPTFEPLPADLRVRLSETSFEIAPRSRHAVYYEVSAARLPAWFTIYSTITGPRPSSGVQVRVQLPHTVYVYGDPLTRDDVALDRAEWVRGADSVVVRVRNGGPRLGRVQVARVEGGGPHVDYPGFPVFPGSERTIHIPWTGDAAPVRVTLDFGDFRLQGDVAVVDAPEPGAPGDGTDVTDGHDS